MLTLKAQKRKIFGKKNKKLRKLNVIPAVVYGPGVKSRSIKIFYLPFKKIFSEVGKSSIFNLEIDNEKPINALIHAIQIDPITNKIQHVDFYQIKAGEKVAVKVKLKFIGEAPAVKKLGGSLITNLTELEIECLPKDLINVLDVDISKLTTFEDAIRIKDLDIPKEIKVFEDINEVIAQVVPPRAEEEPEEKAEETTEKEGTEAEGEKQNEKKEGIEDQSSNKTENSEEEKK